MAKCIHIKCGAEVNPEASSCGCARNPAKCPQECDCRVESKRPVEIDDDEQDVHIATGNCGKMENYVKTRARQEKRARAQKKKILQLTT